MFPRFAGADWRDDHAYRYVRGLDAAGVAWELLRRNPGYREEAGAVPFSPRDAEGYVELRDPPACSGRWGLGFRAASRPRCAARALVLAIRGRRRRDHRRCNSGARKPARCSRHPRCGRRDGDSPARRARAGIASSRFADDPDRRAQRDADRRAGISALRPCRVRAARGAIAHASASGRALASRSDAGSLVPSTAQSCPLEPRAAHDRRA